VPNYGKSVYFIDSPIRDAKPAVPVGSATADANYRDLRRLTPECS
jgi:hypothetical protein